MLLFFWLCSSDLAVKRVETRVKEGGHNIPEEIVRRRYENGLTNFFTIFLPIVDEWMFIDNSEDPSEIIAESNGLVPDIRNLTKWTFLKSKYSK
jgi:predicted ABC-type ATPase